jgi:hypothetical protein
MKKILTLAVAALLLTGATYACEGKACCKKGARKESNKKAVAKDGKTTEAKKAIAKKA